MKRHPRLENSLGLSHEVMAATNAVVLAAEKIRSRFLTSAKDLGTIRKSGHHDLVTLADPYSQRLITKILLEEFPEAKFIVEEKMPEFRSAILENPDLEQLQSKLIFCIDPIDGTAQFNNGLPEWCISVGIMKNGRHIGGAILAPEIKNGLLVFGEKDRGIFSNEGVAGNIRLPRRLASLKNKKIEDSVVYFGANTFRKPAYNRFLNRISDKDCHTNCAGACALGLALVAMGKIDALIEPPQSPWDWFGGLPLIEEVGGKVIFFSEQSGKIKILDAAIDKDIYSTTRASAGFIAGKPKLVDWLMKIFVQEYGRR